ncbi:MAG: hypothetical protein KJ718_01705 [Nanoarchaeota archaeon]|nr:hypothetical protein [Nanoarchaeota archaeon]
MKEYTKYKEICEKWKRQALKLGRKMIKEGATDQEIIARLSNNEVFDGEQATLLLEMCKDIKVVKTIRVRPSVLKRIRKTKRPLNEIVDNFLEWRFADA